MRSIDPPRKFKKNHLSLYIFFCFRTQISGDGIFITQNRKPEPSGNLARNNFKFNFLTDKKNQIFQGGSEENFFTEILAFEKFSLIVSTI